MEALITWAKENFDLISLFIGIIGVLIAFISVADEMKKKRDQKKKADKRKK